jgi:hypothetical protein
VFKVGWNFDRSVISTENAFKVLHNAFNFIAFYVKVLCLFKFNGGSK